MKHRISGMAGTMAGLFDRLFDVGMRLSVEDLKDAVARDLEALLNTRTVVGEELLAGYPECARSIVTYGLSDFAGRSLASPTDRAYICGCLQQAIARHEPRLRDVQATLDVREDAINSINFSIVATLVAGSGETVSFDANLQPSSLHYTISRVRRGTTGG